MWAVLKVYWGISSLTCLYYTLKKSIKDEDLNPDFCILNNGGFRSSLNKGPVNIGDIFQIMPFENYLVILEFMEIKWKVY